DEFYRIAFRKKVYDTIGELQADLDLWIDEYNQARTHQGRYCFGKTPMQTFLDATPLARDKQIGEPTHQTYAADPLPSPHTVCQVKQRLLHFIHRLGEIRDRTYENQQHRASGLNLLVTAIILWN